MFGILWQGTNWIKVEEDGSETFAAILRPRREFLYADYEAAERDAQILRARNAQQVEATNRWRKHKAHKAEPDTYTTVAVEPPLIPRPPRE
jgi:hypothetical protein